jgi:hypothetical protein
MKTKLSMLWLLIPVLLTNPVQSQDHPFSQEALDSAPYFFKKQFKTKKVETNLISKKQGHYSKDDWAAVIDSTWGPGLTVEEKLTIFDAFTVKIDEDFACFQNLECDQTVINWDSLVIAYRQEVEDTVSRGRFAAIMHQLCLALKEAHTYADDDFVMNGYPLTPGLPLLVVGGWGNNTHFGAGLTPLPDSNLLVYETIQNHVLGIMPGDIMLGYDGFLWKDLYQEMITVQMPVWGWWWGCSESAHSHSWLMSAGMNWHLFDTIDIVKYSTSDTLHLATSILEGQTESFYCSEQLEITGVPKPDIFNQELFSYGIIDGTDIGYIYGWGWFWDAENEFYQAVSDIMFNYETSGLIIDFRMNYGGNMFLSNLGLELLFNTQDTTIGFVGRNDPDDHCFWGNVAPPGIYVIQGDTGTYYDKPIAVLTGPGAVSSGDQVALRMKFHPMTKVFGKSTTAAFNAPTNINLGNPDWTGRYASADAYLVSDPDNNLTHEEFEVDEYVWHNPEDVAQGIDAVVQAAVDWIDSLTVVTSEPLKICLKNGIKNYPNPFSNQTTIEFTLPNAGFVTLSIYDITGKRLETILSKKLPKGDHKIKWNAKHLSEGIYIIRMETKSAVQVHKALIIK